MDDKNTPESSDVIIDVRSIDLTTVANPRRVRL